jgi:biopolymer transport protein ExbB/TolQ
LKRLAVIVLFGLVVAALCRPVAVRCAEGASATAEKTAPEEKPKQDLLRKVIGFLKRGGILMTPIWLCSILSVAFVFERFFALRKRIIVPEEALPALRQHIANDDSDAALQACSAQASPLTQVIAAALRRSDGTRQEMEEAIETEGARVV